MRLNFIIDIPFIFMISTIFATTSFPKVSVVVGSKMSLYMT